MKGEIAPSVIAGAAKRGGRKRGMKGQVERTRLKEAKLQD